MRLHQLFVLAALSSLLMAAGYPQNENDIADSVHAADHVIEQHHAEIKRWRTANWGVETVQPAVGEGYQVFIQVAVAKNALSIAAKFPKTLGGLPVKVVQGPVAPTATLLPGVWR